MHEVEHMKITRDLPRSNPQKAQREYYFQDNLPPYNLHECLHLYEGVLISP